MNKRKIPPLEQHRKRQRIKLSTDEVTRQVRMVGEHSFVCSDDDVTQIVEPSHEASYGMSIKEPDDLGLELTHDDFASQVDEILGSGHQGDGGFNLDGRSREVLVVQPSCEDNSLDSMFYPTDTLLCYSELQDSLGGDLVNPEVTNSDSYNSDLDILNIVISESQGAGSGPQNVSYNNNPDLDIGSIGENSCGADIAHNDQYTTREELDIPVRHITENTCSTTGIVNIMTCGRDNSYGTHQNLDIGENSCGSMDITHHSDRYTSRGGFDISNVAVDTDCGDTVMDTIVTRPYSTSNDLDLADVSNVNVGNIVLSEGSDLYNTNDNCDNMGTEGRVSDCCHTRVGSTVHFLIDRRNTLTNNIKICDIMIAEQGGSNETSADLAISEDVTVDAVTANASDIFNLGRNEMEQRKNVDDVDSNGNISALIHNNMTGDTDINSFMNDAGIFNIVGKNLDGEYTMSPITEGSRMIDSDDISNTNIFNVDSSELMGKVSANISGNVKVAIINTRYITVDNTILDGISSKSNSSTILVESFKTNFYTVHERDTMAASENVDFDKEANERVINEGNESAGLVENLGSNFYDANRTDVETGDTTDIHVTNGYTINAAFQSNINETIDKYQYSIDETNEFDINEAKDYNMDQNKIQNLNCKTNMGNVNNSMKYNMTQLNTDNVEKVCKKYHNKSTTNIVDDPNIVSINESNMEANTYGTNESHIYNFTESNLKAINISGRTDILERNNVYYMTKYASRAINETNENHVKESNTLEVEGSGRDISDRSDILERNNVYNITKYVSRAVNETNANSIKESNVFEVESSGREGINNPNHTNSDREDGGNTVNPSAVGEAPIRDQRPRKIQRVHQSRRKGERYLPQFKRRVLAFAENHTYTETAAKFGVNIGTVSSWKQECSVNSKTAAPVASPGALAHELFLEWLRSCRESNRDPGAQELQDKARSLFKSGRQGDKSGQWFKMWVDRLGSSEQREHRIQYPQAFKTEVAAFAERSSQIGASRAFNVARKRVFEWLQTFRRQLKTGATVESVRGGPQSVERQGRAVTNSTVDRQIWEWYIAQDTRPTSKQVQARGVELYRANGHININCSYGWFHRWADRFGVSLRHQGDEAVLEWALTELERGSNLTHGDLQTRALGLATPSHGRQFKASPGWAIRFCRRYPHLLRNAPSLATPLPPRLSCKVQPFRDQVWATVQQLELSPGQLGNIDEVHLNFSTAPVSGDTGGVSKRLLRRCGAENCHATIVLACLADGTLLPPTLILKDYLDEEMQEMSNMCILGQEEATMDDVCMEKWLQNIWLRLVPAPNLLVSDCFAPHGAANVVALMAAHEAHRLEIPGGCTSRLQPLDVGIKTLFQAGVERCWGELNAKTLPSSKFRLPSSEELAQWVLQTYNQLRHTHQEDIRQSFLATISRNQCMDYLLSTGSESEG